MREKHQLVAFLGMCPDQGLNPHTERKGRRCNQLSRLTRAWHALWVTKDEPQCSAPVVRVL